MKLDKRAAILLACSFALGSMFVACKGDDDKKEDTGTGGDGDGDGDGDVSGDGGTSGDGDGDAPIVIPSSAPQCEDEGGAQCTGSASGIVCPDGSTDGVPFTCATGEICDDGACVGQCEAGATECVGGAVLRVCTADGREWVNIPCQEGLVCEDGACGLEGGLVCVPGTKDCDGNTARTCNDDGSGYDELDCPGETVCEEGACEGTVCTVGATKCDDSAHYSAMMFEGSEPNLEVIHTCVDGEHWAAQPCPTDEEMRSYCTYDFDRAEAARYRAEVNLWVVQYLFEGPPSQEAFNAFPTGPEIPEGTAASCEPAPQDDRCDDWYEAFFESPVMSRECSDPNAVEDEKGEDFWKGYTECQGLPPYAPLQVVSNECAGLSICDWNNPDRGCSPSNCVPGESICSSESTTDYGVCVYDEGEAYFTLFEGCPDDPSMGGAGPGTCSDDGDAPARQASCGGEPVEYEPIIWD